MLGFGVGIVPGTSAGMVAEAAVAALGPAFLFNFADASSLFVGRNGSGGNPSVGGATSIGLALDKSRMGGRAAADFIASQPETFVNGTFDAGIDGWTISPAASNADITWSSGAIRVRRTVADGAAGARQQLTGLTPGRTYWLKGRVRAMSSPGLAATIIPRGVPGSLTRTSPGDLAGTTIAVGTTVFIDLVVGGTGIGDWVEFDDVSLKPVAGLHHVALADNSRPVAALADGRVVCRTDGVDDALSLSFPSGTVSAASYYAMALATTDGAGSLVQETPGGVTAGFFQPNGSTAGCGVAVDGVLLGDATTTRQTVLNAIASAGGRPVVIELLDVPHAGASGLNFFYNASAPTLMTSGDCYGLVGFASAPAAAGRALVRRWLAGLAGVSTQ